MEEIIIVNSDDTFKQIISKTDVNMHTIIAVELVLILLIDEKKILLLNRGKGACDMQNKWALHSGKIIKQDLAPGDKIGSKLSVDAYKNGAIREFKEELNFSIEADRLDVITQFYMPEQDKKLFFTLFALKLEKSELDKIFPDNSEIDRIKLFTLDEFIDNNRLGDALNFKKDFIIHYLRKNHF